MPREVEVRPIFAITNPNTAWTVAELDRLRQEWADWFEISKALPNSPDYDPKTCSEAIKDGFANRRKHEVLREKTLVFIGNNFSGYDFLFFDWDTHPHESNTSRLATIIPSWVQRLETLSACIGYARVPDSFWKAKGKQLVDAVANKAPESAIEIAASYLRNPLA